jgi:hypothetical protein
VGNQGGTVTEATVTIYVRRSGPVALQPQGTTEVTVEAKVDGRYASETKAITQTATECAQRIAAQMGIKEPETKEEENNEPK